MLGGREKPAASEREGQHSACCGWNKAFLMFIATANLPSHIQFTREAHGVVIDAVFYALAPPTRRDLAKPKRDSFSRGSVLTIASPKDSLVIPELFMSSSNTK